jgi:tetratricopeptide (TPR) repeat protein/energy-coupling factor transporter ATP-binding protein EcfA2
LTGPPHDSNHLPDPQDEDAPGNGPAPEEPGSLPQEPAGYRSIETQGAYIEGQVDTGGGDFVGRDKYVITYITQQVPEREAQDIEDLPPEPGKPPFQGLQYFAEEDAERFFGRETLTARLVARLKQERFLAVIGASGSGKSSLVRAGVIPALRGGRKLAEGVLPPVEAPRWAMLTLAPGAHPLETLATALSGPGAALSELAGLRDELSEKPEFLSLVVGRYLNQQKRPHLLLFIDQFEELFTLCRSPQEREAFISALLQAVSGEGQAALTVLIALRADYYADISRYDQLRLVVAEHQEFIGAMNRDELASAIDRPLALGNWKIQEGLIKTILDDIGYEPGALPLLSHALHETWLRRRGRTLTLSGYTEAGGVRGAIAQTAEAVFRGLPPEHQPVARMIFLRMAEIGQDTQVTRRRATYAEMITRATDELVLEAVIQVLAEARLVITGVLPGAQLEKDWSVSGRVVEVAHEALIREWPAFRGWLEEDREGLILHQNLTADARDWVKMEREAGMLYRGGRLQRVLNWARENQDALSLLDEQFLQASREAAGEEARQLARLQQARRMQRSFGLLAGVLMVVVAYLVYTFLIYRAPGVMDGIYNIAVADFGDLPLEGGRGLHQLVSESIRAELAGNTNFLVWSDSPELWREARVNIGSVAGVTPTERLANAAALGERLRADMLIFGALPSGQAEPGGQAGPASGHGQPLNIEFYLAPRQGYNYEDLQGGFNLGCSDPLDASTEAEAVRQAFDHCARAMAWVAIGLSEAQLGRSLEALEAFFRTERFYPDSEVIQFLLGREYLFMVDREAVLEFVREGFEAKAEEKFARAIQLNPAYPRAYTGLGSVYNKRARRLLHEQQDGVAAAGLVEKSIQLYRQAYELSAASPHAGLPLDEVARLGLGNAYSLKGQVLQQQGDPAGALELFELAIAELQDTLEPFHSARQARYLTQAYEYLGVTFEWKGYTQLLSGANELGLQDYREALVYYEDCITQGEQTQDAIVKREIVEKICQPNWEKVKTYLDGIAGSG